jgi:hypothetical protein
MTTAQSLKLERRRKWWRTVIETQCVRCFKPQPAPDSDELGSWEALDHMGAMACPDCVTPAEQQAVDEADMALSDVLGHDPAS